jgi:hypothetical protein
MWDNRNDTAPAANGAIAGFILALVGQRHARCDVWPDVLRDFKLRAVTDFAAGQMEGDRQPVEIRLEVDF